MIVNKHFLVGAGVALLSLAFFSLFFQNSPEPEVIIKEVLVTPAPTVTPIPTASPSATPNPVAEDFYRKSFVNGCNQDGDAEKQCVCIWEGLRLHYSIEEISKFEAEDFTEKDHAVNAVIDCMQTDS